MIFWSINELKRKLNNNSLPELDYFIYFIINCLQVLFFAWRGAEQVAVISQLFISGIVLPAVCYLFHSHFKCKHFVEKYIAIELICVIRMSVVLILFIIGLSLFYISTLIIAKYIIPDHVLTIYETGKYVYEQMKDQTYIVNIIYEWLWLIFGFWYVSKHYYDLCKNNDQFLV